VTTRVAAAIGLALLVAGCVDPIAPDPLTALLFNATVGARLQVQARLRNDTAFLLVRNPTAVTDTMLYSACTYAVRLYAGPAFRDRVWQSISDEALPCGAPGAITIVPGGDSAFIRVSSLAAAPAYGQVHVYLLTATALLDMIAGVRDVADLVHR
jgi:hypothetical protein